MDIHSLHALSFSKRNSAERLQTKPLILPCLKVDPRLKDEISKITRGIYVTVFIFNLIASIIESPDDRRLLLEKNGAVQKELKKILHVMTNNRNGSPEHSLVRPDVSFNSQEDSTFLIHTIHNVVTRIMETETTLGDIKWGLGIR